ncbi:IclR family transcriptional regulator [Brevibacillus massiliensis]|jgi:DNA-binding IclR family transcriptional regulator|uniref:IclR family transcriptional regulator n=1 Tax=Brevibacillus massiliensis TaxID=1118054 RepID=UPI0002F08F05|nr:IclR family transcriptional regulator [Brevibacillus massiliensis]
MSNALSSVRNACKLLKVFLDSPKELGVTELSKRLELSKGAVHKMLATLESEGFIRQNDSTRQYTLGYTLLELGNKVLKNHDIVEFSTPYLKALAAQTKELAVLCVLDKTDAIYVSRVDSPHPIRFNVDMHRRFPPYSTTASRALLAFQPQEYQEKVLSDEIKSYTAYSFTSVEEIKANLQEIRKRGYEISSNRRNTGVTGIAAPIFDSQQAIASISVIGPSDRMLPQQASILESLLATVRSMSYELGYHG